jgi:hypothetical protein
MSFSMYDASAPVFVRGLGNLAVILGKGLEYAEAKEIDPARFLDARLSPDMFPLSRQVQIASDAVKNGMARLAAMDVPTFPDTETTFPELQERVANTMALMQTVTPRHMEGSEARVVKLKLRGEEAVFSGKTYLLNFVLPNFYFHISATYLILRQKGVELGKADYLGPIA